MRILVCEDNCDSAETLERLLRSDQHEVVVCNNGAACLAKALEWKPAVVFLDIGMPDVSGFAIAQQLRQSELGSQLFMVAVTGYGTREDRRLAMAAGFDVHLTKPADPALVLALAADPKTARS